MRIRVDWKDIFGGLMGSSTGCAVARATQRQVPDLVAVTVSHYGLDAYLRQAGAMRVVSRSFPLEIRNKIRFFDKWHLMRPFEFELAIPAPVVAAPKREVNEDGSVVRESVREMLETELVLV